MKEDQLYRVIDIAEILNTTREKVAYRIKTIGIVPANRWFYNKYQIELIKDFERAPKVKFKIYESKMNFN